MKFHWLYMIFTTHLFICVNKALTKNIRHLINYYLTINDYLILAQKLIYSIYCELSFVSRIPSTMYKETIQKEFQINGKNIDYA